MENWLDLDLDASIKQYEYTHIAAKNMFERIQSEDFEDASGEVIYKALQEQIKIYSFSDYLKRYIYTKFNIQEPMDTFDDYLPIIEDSFVKNGFEIRNASIRKAFRKKVRRWLDSDTIKRQSMFEIGFGLNMSAKDIYIFLTKYLNDSDFDFLNPREAVYWYCRSNDQSWQDAEEILEEYESFSDESDTHPNHHWQAIFESPKLFLHKKEELMFYLKYLKQCKKDIEHKSSAKEVFDKLYQRAEKEIFKFKNLDNENKVNARDIELQLYSGVPITKNGNLKSIAASLKKQCRGKRLSRARIHEIMNGKEVERFDLITLLFLIYGLNEEKLELKSAQRFCDFVDEMNDSLMDANMPFLYPANPYENWILMCIASEDPLDTFATVWEESYVE